MILEKELKLGRWGDGSIKISDVRLDNETYTEKQDAINIIMKAEIIKAVNKPIFGFTVKNGVGTEMFGSNSKLVHYPERKYKVGEMIDVKWTAPNILNDGDYSVDVTAIDGDSFSEYDWWEDAATFGVVRDEHTAYVVEPALKLSIK